MTLETNPVTVGALAKLAGVNVQTIRYYEQRKLLPTPERSAAGYRLYPEATASRVRFIKRAKELGFTLREISDLLALRAAPGANRDDLRGQCQTKIADIELRLQALTAIKSALEGLVGACAKSSSTSECPILEFLEPELGKNHEPTEL